jgi:ABC-type transport system involved in multi-copper enzyme maturation permease subunit
MTQTAAIFLEAYRSLNSKKLFWLVLILSALVVVAFACVGINERGMKILIWQIDNHMLNSEQIPVDQFYKGMFVQIGIGIWLAWLATILALISTAGIFPDLMTSGSIDLFVSKPISRLRLFLTEYLAGLLFAALQVTIFTTACFLVIGLRGGVWEPGLFLAIPLVVCLFSYLFSVCVFLGVVTRSTVAALLLAMLFWFGVWTIGTAERTLLMFKTMQQHGAMTAVHVERDRGTPKAGKSPGRHESAPPTDASPTTAADASTGSRALEVAHDIIYGIKTVLPKTTDTIELLQRSLIEIARLPQQPADNPEARAAQAAQKELIDILYGRSIAWVIGTSLGFEAVVLGFAAIIFCRRDY